MEMWLSCELYLHSDRLFELATLLDLEHQIAAVYVLHDEVESVLARERGTIIYLFVLDSPHERAPLYH